MNCSWEWLILIALILVQIVLSIVRIVDNYRQRRIEDAMRVSLAKLDHSARLISLGEMTASIAHEINQPLGAIVSNTDAAEMMWESGRASLTEIRAILTDIHKDARRASEVVRHVRSLFQRRDTEKVQLNLNDLVSEVRRFVSANAKDHGVMLDVQLAQPGPLLQANPVQLQQVLVILMLNGIDAMETIPAQNKVLTVRTIWRGHQEVEITIADTGRGFGKEHKERLFEPFFTTKPNGTGLGLSIARSIVELHGGKITAKNNPDGGACFQISLPAQVWPSIQAGK